MNKFLGLFALAFVLFLVISPEVEAQKPMVVAPYPGAVNSVGFGNSMSCSACMLCMVDCDHQCQKKFLEGRRVTCIQDCVGKCAFKC
ncbi:hypothetical protein Ciccas_006113 [Cichlidogyrus casuarinus]|uniref:Uncharacterized protein n=1 Tax=Cichlidogyrus casuarinus TaxID=1844966 RepID=A0ABD2Q6R3_9PLAT